MTYQPFLPEVSAGSVEARHAAVSLRSHLHRSTLVPGTVTTIDHARKRAVVELGGGGTTTLDYDVVVVTAGAVTRRLPVPGVGEHAIGLKHVERPSRSGTGCWCPSTWRRSSRPARSGSGC